MADQLSSAATLTPTSSPRPYGMNRALVVIDFGNGQIKSMVRQGNKNEWQRVTFPSAVARGIGSFLVDGEPMIIGADAQDHSCQRTGATDQGKIDNALPVLMQVLFESVGFDRPLTVELVFTCPSVKEYGERIRAKLLGEHAVEIEGDPLAMTERVRQTVTVAAAVAQLEGHQAQSVAPTNAKGERYLIDVGNRTVIATCVAGDSAAILHRYRAVWNQCGVAGICSKIRQAEALVGLPHAPMMPSLDKVIGYLLDTKFSKTDEQKVAAAITPYMNACLADVAAWVNERRQSNDSVVILGGGALLPGIKGMFGGKVAVVKDPAWATVNGLVELAPKLIGASYDK